MVARACHATGLMCHSLAIVGLSTDFASVKQESAEDLCLSISKLRISQAGYSYQEMQIARLKLTPCSTRDMAATWSDHGMP
jgi:hypothetical protein